MFQATPRETGRTLPPPPPGGGENQQAEVAELSGRLGMYCVASSSMSGAGFGGESSAGVACGLTSKEELDRLTKALLVVAGHLRSPQKVSDGLFNAGQAIVSVTFADAPNSSKFRQLEGTSGSDRGRAAVSTIAKWAITVCRKKRKSEEAALELLKSASKSTPATKARLLARFKAIQNPISICRELRTVVEALLKVFTATGEAASGAEATVGAGAAADAEAASSGPSVKADANTIQTRHGHPLQPQILDKVGDEQSASEVGARAAADMRGPGSLETSTKLSCYASHRRVALDGNNQDSTSKHRVDEEGEGLGLGGVTHDDPTGGAPCVSKLAIRLPGTARSTPEDQLRHTRRLLHDAIEGRERAERCLLEEQKGRKMDASRHRAELEEVQRVNREMWDQICKDNSELEELRVKLRSAQQLLSANQHLASVMKEEQQERVSQGIVAILPTQVCAKESGTRTENTDTSWIPIGCTPLDGAPAGQTTNTSFDPLADFGRSRDRRGRDPLADVDTNDAGATIVESSSFPLVGPEPDTRQTNAGFVDVNVSSPEAEGSGASPPPKDGSSHEDGSEDKVLIENAVASPCTRSSRVDSTPEHIIDTWASSSSSSSESESEEGAEDSDDETSEDSDNDDSSEEGGLHADGSVGETPASPRARPSWANSDTPQHIIDNWGPSSSSSSSESESEEGCEDSDDATPALSSEENRVASARYDILEGAEGLGFLSSLSDLDTSVVTKGTKIGGGGAGEIFKLEMVDADLNNQLLSFTVGTGVILKQFKQREEENARREIEVLASLMPFCHVNIINVFSTNIEKRTIVMEKMRMNLQTLIEDREILRRVSHNNMIGLCLGVAKGLQYMHDIGFAHGDVKPENIVVSDDLRTSKLIDFGSAGKAGVAKVETLTLPYAPPEAMGLMNGDTVILRESMDVWSVAVVVMQAVTRREMSPTDDTALSDYVDILYPPEGVRAFRRAEDNIRLLQGSLYVTGSKVDRRALNKATWQLQRTTDMFLGMSARTKPLDECLLSNRVWKEQCTLGHPDEAKRVLAAMLNADPRRRITMKAVADLLEHTELWTRALDPRRPKANGTRAASYRAAGFNSTTVPRNTVEPLSDDVCCLLSRVDEVVGGEVVGGPSWLEMEQAKGEEWWRTLPPDMAERKW